jgi:hypothetical protein
MRTTRKPGESSPASGRPEEELRVAQREPQIRTNLDDEVYQVPLDELMSKVPGALAAGLVNVRFREGSLRLPGGRAADAASREALIALTAGLFGGEAGERDPGYAAALAEVRPAESAYLSMREETLLASRLGDSGLALLLAVPPNLNQGTSNSLRRSLSEAIAGSDRREIGSLLEGNNDVLQGVLLNLGAAKVLDRYERFAGASVLALDGDLIAVMRSLFTTDGPVLGLRLRHRDGRALEIRRAELVTATRSLHFARLRFDPEHLMVIAADLRAVPGLLSIMMRSSETETVRVWVDGLLSYGVKSTMSPFPSNQGEFLDIVRQLRQLDENDLLGRLDIGGFANYTIGEGDDMQRCQECIYYLPNSRWCDLPELPVPVEPHWWCRLWKM